MTAAMGFEDLFQPVAPRIIDAETAPVPGQHLAGQHQIAMTQIRADSGRRTPADQRVGAGFQQSPRGPLGARAADAATHQEHVVIDLDGPTHGTILHACGSRLRGQCCDDA